MNSIYCKAILSAALMFSLLAMPLSAQDRQPLEETQFDIQPGDDADLDHLRDILIEAAENNPELRARYADYRYRLEDIPQAGSLPDPEIMFSFFTNPPEADPLAGRFMAEAMQGFPWFGTLSAQRERERLFANAEYHRFERAKLELFRDVEHVWYEYAALTQTIRFMEQNLELLHSLRPLVDVRYETAQAGQVDVLRINMQVDELESELERLRDERSPLRTRLNELIGREPGASIEVPDRLPDASAHIHHIDDAPALPFDLEDADALLDHSLNSLRDAFLDVAIQNDPQLRAREAEAEAYQSAREVARKQGLPSFGIGVEVMGRHFGPMRMMEGGESVFLKASIKVPLYRGQYRAQERQAEIGEERAHFERAQRESRLASQIEASLKNFRDATREINLYRDRLIPQATQSLDVLESAYTGGQVRLDELIQMQRELINHLKQLVDAQIMQHHAGGELIRLVGGGLHLQPEYEEPAH